MYLTSDFRRVSPFTYHEIGKTSIVITTNGTYHEEEATCETQL